MLRCRASRCGAVRRNTTHPVWTNLYSLFVFPVSVLCAFFGSAQTLFFCLFFLFTWPNRIESFSSLANRPLPVRTICSGSLVNSRPSAMTLILYITIYRWISWQGPHLLYQSVFSRSSLRAQHRFAEGLVFYRCGFFSFFFLSSFLPSFFFRRLISKVTERILTKLGHIFTYDCYLKKLVWTPPGIYLHGLGAKTLLGPTLNFDRTYLCNGTRYQQSEKLVNLPYILSKFGEFWSTNGWGRLASFCPPLNFRVGRHCQPYRMDVV